MTETTKKNLEKHFADVSVTTSAYANIFGGSYWRNKTKKNSWTTSSKLLHSFVCYERDHGLESARKSSRGPNVCELYH